MAHFFLLSALPRDRMSRPAIRAHGIAREKFRHLYPDYFNDRSGGIGGSIVSPIPHDRLHLVSDRVWRDIVSQYTDQNSSEIRNWRQINASTAAESSAETFSRDLGVMARRQPRRFARFAVKIRKESSPRYLSEIMRAFEATSPPDGLSDREAFSWEMVPASEIEAVFRHAQSLGHAGLEHSLCAVVRNRPDAGWSDWAINEVSRLAIAHPDPKPEALVIAKDWKDRTVEDLDLAAINHVRGPAAQAVHSLLFHSKDLLERLTPVINALSVDVHPGVRVAAIGICLPVWNIDRKVSVDWFLKICECDDDRLLACDNAIRFVNLAQVEFLERVKPIVVRMLTSEIDEVIVHGAARATFVWLDCGKLSDLFDECLNGSANHRKGVAMIAAQNATDPKRGAQSRTLLAQLFNDPDAEVRAEALTIFRRIDVLECPEMQQLVASYISSRAYEDKPTEILSSFECYKSSLVPFRDALFAVCESLSGELASDSRSMATEISYEADKVPSLLLRLYEQAQGKELMGVQDKCLDTWDRLLESRVGKVRGLIEKLDL